MNKTNRPRSRRAAPRRKAGVSQLAAQVQADREHYEALMADARSDLEALSIYLDGIKDVASLENLEWRKALELVQG